MERIVQTLKKTGIWDRCYHIQVKINHTPSPPKLHYHVIIHFEIHVYLHFPVSLYIQSLNFIDCYGTMVVLFIRDVVCVWGGDGGVAHCFKTELQLLSTDSIWPLFQGREATDAELCLVHGYVHVSCTQCKHNESAVKQCLRASSWFSWYRTPYKFNLSHSVPKSNQLRWLSLVNMKVNFEILCICSSQAC